MPTFRLEFSAGCHAGVLITNGANKKEARTKLIEKWNQHLSEYDISVAEEGECKDNSTSAMYVFVLTGRTPSENTDLTITSQGQRYPNMLATLQSAPIKQTSQEVFYFCAE